MPAVSWCFEGGCLRGACTLLVGAIGEGEAFGIPLLCRLPQLLLVGGERQDEGVSDTPSPMPGRLKLQVKADLDLGPAPVWRERAEHQVRFEELQGPGQGTPLGDRPGDLPQPGGDPG